MAALATTMPWHSNDRKREKHQNADGLSKKTDHYVEREAIEENAPGQVDSFRFLADPRQFMEIPDLEELDEIEEHGHGAMWIWHEAQEPSSNTREWTAAMEDVLNRPSNTVCTIVQEMATHKYRVEDLVAAQRQDVAIRMIRLLMKNPNEKIPCEAALATKVKT